MFTSLLISFNCKIRTITNELIYRELLNKIRSKSYALYNVDLIAEIMRLVFGNASSINVGEKASGVSD